MPARGGRFLRDHAFLVAAAALPVAVVAFFLLATAVPRWMVDPPAYDLLIRATGPYDPAARRRAVDFAVRDGRVEATVRALPANSYPQLSALFRFDHTTLDVREVPVDLPSDLAEGDPPTTVVVAALADRQVIAGAKAPDGYEVVTRTRSGPGLIGDLFGMHRYGHTTSLVKSGRSIPLALPPPYRDQSSVSAVGWLAGER
jgi:hypothetical protein